MKGATKRATVPTDAVKPDFEGQAFTTPPPAFTPEAHAYIPRLDDVLGWAVRTHLQGHASLDGRGEKRGLYDRNASAATMLLWLLGGDGFSDMMDGAIGNVARDLENTSYFAGASDQEVVEHLSTMAGEASVRLRVIQNILQGASLVLNRIPVPPELARALEEYTAPKVGG